MNLRKRGLALLMCICMVFTLLPFSVFAEDTENGNRGGTEGTAQPSVVYGTYDEDGLNWTPDSTITDPTQTYKNVTYSKTAAPTAVDDTYDITLNVSTTVKKSAVVLVLDTSKSSLDCADCGQSYNENLGNIDGNGHKGDCDYYTVTYLTDKDGNKIQDEVWDRKQQKFVPAVDKDGNPVYKKTFTSQPITDEQNFLAAEKASATEFIKNYAGSVAGMGKYIQIVSFSGTANIALTEWVDVSTTDGMEKAVAAINGLTSETANKDKNLEQGLAKAYDCVMSAPADVANKYVIAVTNSWFNKAGADGNANYAFGLDSADMLKDNDCTVYTVYCRNNESPRDRSNGMIYTYLEEKVASPDCAYANTDTGVLYKASWLKNTIGTTILESMKLDTVPTFTVTDPMSKYVTLESKNPTDSTITNENGIDTITWTPTAPSSTDGDTISFTLKYTIKLNTGTEGFEYSKYYPTNGKTTLKINDNDALSFFVPGVKAAESKTIYIVNYIWNGEHIKASETFDCKVGDVIKYGGVATDNSVKPVEIEGYTAKPVALSELKISETATQNVINFYYYKNVEITAKSDSVMYDGKEHSVSGFTGAPKDADFSAITVGTKGTKVDVYPADFAAETVGTVDNTGNYIITKATNGQLEITSRPYIPPVNPSITDKITVEITGNSDSVVYDGTEHSVKDYTVKISDSRYTEKDFTFSGKALASGVNAGAYEMGLKADQFKNTNARFKNVEFIIKADGVLTITQRPLTITAGSAEGIAPVTCDKYTVEGLATGDKVDSVKITGIQSEPGESPNVASDAVIKNAKGEDVTANYKITYVDGVLKAIEVLNKEIHFNYVIGYTDGTIRPNNDISRAEVATIFFRLLTDEAREQYTTTAGNFTDVKAGMWCNRAIATLTNMGIIKGYTDGSFQPNKSITRAELATIIARFAKLDVNTKTFSDINGHWAQKNIELAAGNGWINGYEDGTFRPNNNITRAETFAMINRVLDRQTESVSDLLPTSEMNMWSDNLNENAWYYKDVQEATNYHKCDRVGDSVYEKWTEKVPDIDWASYQI